MKLVQKFTSIFIQVANGYISKRGAVPSFRKIKIFFSDLIHTDHEDRKFE